MLTSAPMLKGYLYFSSLIALVTMQNTFYTEFKTKTSP